MCVCVCVCVCEKYNTTLVPVGDDLSYNSWFPNVSNSLSLVRYVLETTRCKINRLQRVLVWYSLYNALLKVYCTFIHATPLIDLSRDILNLGISMQKLQQL